VTLTCNFAAERLSRIRVDFRKLLSGLRVTLLVHQLIVCFVFRIHYYYYNKSTQKLRNHFFSPVLMVLAEDLRLHEILVKLTRLINFALHELAAESVVLINHFQKLFFRKRSEKRRLCHVADPVHLKAFQESLRHMFEVTSDIEIVHSDPLLAAIIKMVQNKGLWLQHQTFFVFHQKSLFCFFKCLFNVAVMF